MTRTERLCWAINSPDTATQALYGVFEELSDNPEDDVRGRKLCCTPFRGAYGRAGWVIAVNGSPPRGMLTVLTSEGDLYPTRPGLARANSHRAEYSFGLAQPIPVVDLLQKRGIASGLLLCLDSEGKLAMARQPAD